MGLTITGATGIQAKLNKLTLGFVESDKKLVKIVSEARNRMVKRDLKGYTPSLKRKYRDWKTDKVGRSKRDLQLKGQMHNAEQVKRIPRGAMIYFNDETERKKAYAHHFGRNNQPKTKFFRLGKENEQYIFNEWRKPIRKALR